MKNTTRVMAVAAIFAVQLLAIGWLIFRYERIVSGGTECRFACRGYDPYDPFRGRYVRLDVRADCDSIPGGDLDGLDEIWFKIDPKGGTNSLSRIVEAAVAPSGDGLWVRFSSREVSKEYRLRWNDRQKDESYEDFHRRQEAAGQTYRASLPDWFFMNEKLAPKAEDAIRGSDSDLVAVYRVLDGEMVLVDVEMDGRPIDECLR